MLFRLLYIWKIYFLKCFIILKFNLFSKEVKLFDMVGV